MKRQRRDNLEMEMVSEINMTPLMDLTFLLLIVFMITAPMLEFGLDVSLPDLNAEIVDEGENVYVNLTASGEVVVDNQTMEQDKLTEYLRTLSSRRPHMMVLVRADEQRPYGDVIGVMRSVRTAGITDVALVTEPEQ